MVLTGAIGVIAGCEVIKSRRVPLDGGKFTNFIVQLSPEVEDGQPALDAVTLYMKRDVLVETDRDIKTKTNSITVDQHYTVALTNESKVLKVQFKEK